MVRVKTLLDAGADPNHHGEKTPAPLAYWIVMEPGGVRNVGNATGKRLEELLVRGFTIDVLQLMLDRGADVNARTNQGHSVLHGFMTVPIAQQLLAAGADVNARDENGRTPLHSAWDPRVARLYLEAGARPNARDNNGRTALFTAGWAERGGRSLRSSTQVELLETLLAGGVDPQLAGADEQDPDERPANHGRAVAILETARENQH